MSVSLPVSYTFSGTNGSAFPADWIAGEGTAGSACLIESNYGRFDTGTLTGYTGRVTRRIDFTSPLADVEITGTLHYDSTESYGVVMARADNALDGQNGYNLLLGQNLGTLKLQKVVNYTSTDLASFTYNILNNTTHNFRLRVVGTTIQARVWANGSTEPTTWQANVVDSDPALSGGGAVGLIAEGGNPADGYFYVQNVSVTNGADSVNLAGPIAQLTLAAPAGTAGASTIAAGPATGLTVQAWPGIYGAGRAIGAPPAAAAVTALTGAIGIGVGVGVTGSTAAHTLTALAGTVTSAINLPATSAALILTAPPGGFPSSYTIRGPAATLLQAAPAGKAVGSIPATVAGPVVAATATAPAGAVMGAAIVTGAAGHLMTGTSAGLVAAVVTVQLIGPLTGSATTAPAGVVVAGVSPFIAAPRTGLAITAPAGTSTQSYNDTPTTPTGFAITAIAGGYPALVTGTIAALTVTALTGSLQVAIHLEPAAAGLHITALPGVVDAGWTVPGITAAHILTAWPGGWAVTVPGTAAAASTAAPTGTLGTGAGVTARWTSLGLSTPPGTVTASTSADAVGPTASLTLTAPAGVAGVVPSVAGPAAAWASAAPAGSLDTPQAVTIAAPASPSLAASAPAGTVLGVYSLAIPGPTTSLAVTATAGSVLAVHLAALTTAAAVLTLLAPAGDMSTGTGQPAPAANTLPWAHLRVP